MAHNIDFSNGRANVAFLGSRKDVWHHLGQEMSPGMTIDQWAAAAGLDWTAEKQPVFAGPAGTPCDGWRAIMRSDNQHCLGVVSDRYQPVQPRDVLEWFERYIAVDDRFQIDVAGSLKKGEIIWATATFRDPIEIAGDKHVARVLMTTTFDGTGSTINQGTMTRTVCNNTLNVALADRRAVVKTRHNTRFDAAKVGAELAQIAQGFSEYKAMGDAMAQRDMTKADVSEFFKACLDIPLDVKHEDLSGRKQNQFAALVQSYRTTAREGAQGNAWAALQSVTRYVDHERSSRGGDDKVEGRFTSAQFGSGAALKSKAVSLLLAKMEATLAAAPASSAALPVDLLANMERALMTA
jgi:phage/plasmid-like protein (TIGR03299 family)